MRIINPIAIGSTEGAFSRASVATFIGSTGLLETAAAGELRVEYDGATGLCKGALIEPAGTNLALNSANYSAATWSKTRASILDEAILGPGGVVNAQKVCEDNATGPHHVSVSSFAFVAGTTYGLTSFVRAAERSEAVVQMGNGAAFTSSPSVRVDLLTGALLSQSLGVAGYRIKQLAGGWWMVSVWGVATTTATDSYFAAFVSNAGVTSYTGTPGWGIYLGGSQLEVGLPTSYINTAGSVGVRAADVVTGVPPCLVLCDAEEPYGLWASGVSYVVGHRIRLASTSRVYESLVGTNLNNPPDTSPLAWVDIGPANRFAAFDKSSGTATSRTGPLTIAIKPGVADSLGLLDLVGGVAAVRMYDSASAEVFASAVSLRSGAVIGWFDYFFSAITRRTAVVLDGLPPISSACIFVTIDDPDSAAIGTLAAGRIANLGGTLYGAQVGIIDYSVKATDAFGTTTVTKRNYAKRLQAQVQVESTSVDAATSALSKLRATPVVWDGLTGYDSGAILGWAREWSVDISYPNVSYCSLTIEGLA